jgi:glucosyl-dolichyl phosphate glucuronosyltransferase
MSETGQPQSLFDPLVSVVVCAYSDERRQELCRALNSIAHQIRKPYEIVAVIDHNPALQSVVAQDCPNVKVISNACARGLSGARNTGVQFATGNIIAFLDDDAVADPEWLKRLVYYYAHPSVIGVGGAVIPMWPISRPNWFPEEFNWVIGCSYKGQPEKTAPVRNPIGCNMSFRRSLFDVVGGFQEGMGREGADASGCEETEFCIRARQAFPQSIILYDPTARVHHQVTSERARWTYFRKRCLAEGRSKTLVVKKVGPQHGLSSERNYVMRVLPAGVLRGVRETILNFDPWGIARAGGILAGLGYTTFGYFGAKLKNSWS